MHWVSGHSTSSDGRKAGLVSCIFLYILHLLLAFMPGVHTAPGPMGTGSSFTRGKATAKRSRPFTEDKKLSYFSTLPHVMVTLFVQKQKGNCMFITPWLFPLELFMSCFYSPRSCPRLVFVFSVDSLACIFYPFLVFRSFVVRRLLPNADTRQWPATPVLLRPWVAPPLDSPTGRLRQWCNRGTYCSEVGT